MAANVKVKWAKRFEPAVRHEGATLAQMGRLAAKMLRTRIRDQQKDADGRPLRPLSNRAFEVPIQDKRWKPTRSRQEVRRDLDRGGKLRDGDEVRRRAGKNQWRNVITFPSGYAAAKRALGARGVKNLSLTGSLWRSLAVRIKGGGMAKSGRLKNRRIELQFAGSDRNIKTIRGGKLRSMRQRDKARIAFYGRFRKGSSNQRSQLTRLSDAELDRMAAIYVDALDLFA